MNYLIVAYDISDNKLRAKFSKFLEKYGIRLQYSVFELKASTRVLNLVKAKIEGDFSKKFGGADSVVIFKINNQESIKYGNAIHRDQDLLIL